MRMLERLKKFVKIIMIIVLCIFLINITFWSLAILNVSAIKNIYENGIVVKSKLTNTAYAFVHGAMNYSCDKEALASRKFVSINDVCNKTHVTIFKGKIISTEAFVSELHEEGFNVWGTWCKSNGDFMASYTNGSKVEWFDWVDRNEETDITFVYFWGLGFARLNLEESRLLTNIRKKLV